MSLPVYKRGSSERALVRVKTGIYSGLVGEIIKAEPHVELNCDVVHVESKSFGTVVVSQNIVQEVDCHGIPCKETLKHNHLSKESIVATPAVATSRQALKLQKEIEKIRKEVSHDFAQSKSILEQIHIRISDKEHHIYSPQEVTMIDQHLRQKSAHLNTPEMETLLGFILLIDSTDAGLERNLGVGSDVDQALSDAQISKILDDVRISTWGKACASLVRHILYTCSLISQYHECKEALEHVYDWFVSTCGSSDNYALLMSRYLMLRADNRLSSLAQHYLEKLTGLLSTPAADQTQNNSGSTTPAHLPASDNQDCNKAMANLDLEEVKERELGEVDDIQKFEEDSRPNYQTRKKVEEAQAWNPVYLWSNWSKKHASELLPAQISHLDGCGKKQSIRLEINKKKLKYEQFQKSFATAELEAIALANKARPKGSQYAKPSKMLKAIVMQKRAGNYGASISQSEIKHMTTEFDISDSIDDENDYVDVKDLYHFFEVDIDPGASIFKLRKRAAPYCLSMGPDSKGKILPHHLRQPLDFYYTYYGTYRPVVISSNDDLIMAFKDAMENFDKRLVTYILQNLAHIAFFLTADINDEESLYKGLSMLHELISSISSQVSSSLLHKDHLIFPVKKELEHSSAPCIDSP